MRNGTTNRATGAGAGARAGGFTLVELLVAIGAVSIVAVGLAAIFQTITRTVTGGQRVSALTQYAATLETQLRDDFARMTREGFLVIRHQATTSPSGVAGMPAPGEQLPVLVHREDSNPRVRRVDEIMFIAQGDFRTAREPLNPEMVARSTYASIYYGHGLRPIQDNDPLRLRPNFNEDNARARAPWLGERSPTPGDVYPSQYAADWTLLRKATLLVQPGTSRQPVPGTGWPAGLTPRRDNVRDSDNQIMLQPAASSLFRRWSSFVHVRPVDVVRWDPPANRPPMLSSGLVDIATADPTELRAVVQSCNLWPEEVTRRADLFPPVGQPSPINGEFEQVQGDRRELNRMHAWMRNALPAQSSMKPQFDNSSGRWLDMPNAAEPAGARVRFEEYPPDYLGVITDNWPNAAFRGSRRADQTMLTQSRFVPRCSEFIVEWSFGETENLGNGVTRVKWYGTSEVQGGRIAFRRYDQRLYRPFEGRGGFAASHVVDPDLVYSSAIPQVGDPLTACFGWIDPTYRPPTAQQQQADPNAPQSVPWAWPKMVRITIAIVDDKDPSIEERLQFVLETPGTPAP
ncbi:MAG: type II secretion system protein [Phycisphaeraceae bacterium]|nr:MAG: type II secretion system protein [Phycisphaeraceae bacterium]